MAHVEKAFRKRIFKSGVIEFGGGCIDCTVRNLSDAGAALLVASPFGIPTQFNLVIAAEGFVRPCNVVWQKNNQLGISFRDSSRQ